MPALATEIDPPEAEFDALSPELQALEDAIVLCDGVARFANRINVSASAPSMWKKRKRVPAEHCPAIERETGVICERLRPDVPWDVLRMQAGQVDSVTQ